MINNVILKNIVREKLDNTTKVTTTVLTVNTKKMSKAESETVLQDLYNIATNNVVEEITEEKIILDYSDSKYSNTAEDSYTLSSNALDDNTLIYIDGSLAYEAKKLSKNFEHIINVYSNSLGDAFISNISDKDIFIKIVSAEKNKQVLNINDDRIIKTEDSCSFWLSVNTREKVQKALRENSNKNKSRFILAHTPLEEGVTLTIKLGDEVLGVIENYKTPEQLSAHFNTEIKNIYFYNSSSNQVIVFNRYFREQQISFQIKEKNIDLVELWDKKDQGVFVNIPENNLTVFNLGNYLT